ncbi:MAG: hypothetical protein IJZ10_02595 [Thermoguttaceae bacterium]|nr:hypothetical protein [Thermoguttaceae bacterium]
MSAGAIQKRKAEEDAGALDDEAEGAASAFGDVAFDEALSEAFEGATTPPDAATGAKKKQKKKSDDARNATANAPSNAEKNETPAERLKRGRAAKKERRSVMLGVRSSVGWGGKGERGGVGGAFGIFRVLARES